MFVNKYLPYTANAPTSWELRDRMIDYVHEN